MPPRRPPRKSHPVRNIILLSVGAIAVLGAIGGALGGNGKPAASSVAAAGSAVVASAPARAATHAPTTAAAALAPPAPPSTAAHATAPARPSAPPHTTAPVHAAVPVRTSAPPAPPPVPVRTPPPAPPPATTAPASCHPLTNGGNCYEPGEFCRKGDHGSSGVAGDGEAIICEDNDGWRWEPA